MLLQRTESTLTYKYIALSAAVVRTTPICASPGLVNLVMAQETWSSDIMSVASEVTSLLLFPTLAAMEAKYFIIMEVT